MKHKRAKQMILCFFFWMAACYLNAQSLEVGVKAGVVPSKAAISNDLPFITFKTLTEFSAGMFFSLYLEKAQIGFQPEIRYTVKGFDCRETDEGQEISSKYKISYIEIPLLFFYRFPLKGSFKPDFVFGPYLGFAQKATEVQTAFGETEKRDVGDNLKKTDIGIVVGANIQYRLGLVGLTIGVRGSIGLVNLSRDIKEVSWDFDDDDTIMNRAFTASLGLSFNLLSKQ